MKAKHLSNILVLLTSLLSITLIGGCKKDEENSTVKKGDMVYDPKPYAFNLPEHFPNFIVPKDNPTTIEGVALGKKLYYDKTLSIGGPLEGNACASCHNQSKNFSNNKPGTSVLSHTNLQWASFFLWNGKVEGTLEDIMLFEVTEFFKADIALFNADTSYQRMCYEAFGTKTISATEMSYAMAQWLRTLMSTNSKFDRFFNFKEELTPLEQRGYQLFNTEAGDCFHCHSTPLTTDHNFHNIGLDSIPVGADAGRYNVTGDPSDIGKFLVPTLRNVALTAPYMHDGRFKTLEEVIEHYNSGVKHSNTLDPIMTKPGKEYGLQLTATDKAALVAFLKTFTDDEYLTNPEYSDPFK